MFDFDGVILESVATKGTAFRQLMPGQPHLQDRIEQFHLQNLGMSRFDKFAWMYRELLHLPLSAEEPDRLDRMFSDSIAAAMRDCPFVPGARAFIDRQAGRWPLFIASRTPEGELRSTVADRGLASLFAGIYGSPHSKADALTRITREVGAACDELVFVGDGRQDADAARETGVRFIERVAEGDSDEFGEVPIMRVADLAELERRLFEALA